MFWEGRKQESVEYNLGGDGEMETDDCLVKPVKYNFTTGMSWLKSGIENEELETQNILLHGFT